MDETMTYTIKPLEWEKHKTQPEMFTAQAPRPSQMYYNVWKDKNVWKWNYNDYATEQHDFNGGKCRSVKSAKAAAEAHWHETIKQVLVDA